MDAQLAQIPRHIAIIMDGNGRWATQRGYPRYYGHIRGSTRIHDIVDTARLMGVKALTLYAFSTENWNRPELEIQIVFKLLSKYLKKQLPIMLNNNIRFSTIGDLSRLPGFARDVIKTTVQKLEKNTGMFFNLAVNYGSRQELVKAINKISGDIQSGKIKQIDENILESYLETSFLSEYSNVDLVIRSSGEQRVSNFLLWQVAYAEFIFIDTLWPEFTSQHFIQAVQTYTQRDRRYGGIRK